MCCTTSLYALHHCCSGRSCPHTPSSHRARACKGRGSGAGGRWMTGAGSKHIGWSGAEGATCCGRRLNRKTMMTSNYTLPVPLHTCSTLAMRSCLPARKSGRRATSCADSSFSYLREATSRVRMGGAEAENELLCWKECKKKETKHDWQHAATLEPGRGRSHTLRHVLSLSCSKPTRTGS